MIAHFIFRVTHQRWIRRGMLMLLSCLPATVSAEDANPVPSQNIHVILLAGQSNAVGWGYHAYLQQQRPDLAVAQGDVDFFYDTSKDEPLLETGVLHELQSGSGKPKYKPKGVYPELQQEPINRFGPELSLGQYLKTRLPAERDRLAIVKYAVGATKLVARRHWWADGSADASKDGDLYRNFQQTVYGALDALQQKYPDAEVEIRGMAWVQGESDAVALKGNEYAGLLRNFIQDVRLTFGKPQLPVAVVQLSPHQVHPRMNQQKQEHWERVRAAQSEVAAADADVELIRTEAETFKTTTDSSEGPLHYNSQALIVMGEALGDSLAGLLSWDKPQDKDPEK